MDKFDFLRSEIDESVGEGVSCGDGSSCGFTTVTSSNGPSKPRASKSTTKRKTTPRGPKAKADTKTPSDSNALAAAEAMMKREAEMNNIFSSTATENGDEIIYENENYSDGEE